MAFPDYKKDLLDDTVDVNYILDRYFHSGQSVVFHGAPPDEEAELKYQVATALFRAFDFRIHPFQLVICGRRIWGSRQSLQNSESLSIRPPAILILL